jgi:hypothetical protein
VTPSADALRYKAIQMNSKLSARMCFGAPRVEAILAMVATTSSTLMPSRRSIDKASRVKARQFIRYVRGNFGCR